MDETAIQVSSGEVLEHDLLPFYISANASLSQLGIQALKQGDTFVNGLRHPRCRLSPWVSAGSR